MHIPRYSLRKLAYFVATADAGTLTAAAKQLHVTQSALSESITTLEQDTGVQLLRRKKAKGVELTEAGRQILKYARSMLQLSEEFQSHLEAIDEQIQGEITIGCYPTLLPFVVPKLMVAAQQHFPSLQLNFIEGTQSYLQQMVLEGRADIAISYDIDLLPSIHTESLFQLKPHIQLSSDHKLAKKKAIDLKEIYQEPLILLDLSPSMINTSSFFHRYGLEPNIWHRTASFELMRSLVARNFGYAIVMHRQKRNISYEGLPISVKEISNELPSTSVCLIYEDKKIPTKKADAFAEIAKQVIGSPQVFS